MSGKHESVITRIISKLTGAKVAVRENLFYETAKGGLDFANDDLINKRACLAYIAGTIPAITLPKIAAGTSIPKNIVMNTTYAGYGTDPTFIFKVPAPGDGTGTKLQQFNDIYAVFNYADNTLAELVSIDVWGHTDGSDGNGNFAEDTYLTIKI